MKDRKMKDIDTSVTTSSGTVDHSRLVVETSAMLVITCMLVDDRQVGSGHLKMACSFVNAQLLWLEEASIFQQVVQTYPIL